MTIFQHHSPIFFYYLVTNQEFESLNAYSIVSVTYGEGTFINARFKLVNWTWTEKHLWVANSRV